MAPVTVTWNTGKRTGDAIRKLNGGRALRICCGAGDCNTNIAEIDFADLMRELTPCSRLAERATVPFRIQDWHRA